MATIYTHHNNPEDPLYGQVTQQTVPDPPTIPKILAKTDFRAYAVSQLGGSTTGMARFQAIMDAAEGSTGVPKFCFTQYQDAGSMIKSDVDNFLQILVAANLTNGPTQQEHDNVIGNWPNQ